MPTDHKEQKVHWRFIIIIWHLSSANYECHGHSVSFFKKNQHGCPGQQEAPQEPSSIVLRDEEGDDETKHDTGPNVSTCHTSKLNDDDL
jgi:hypothetical protein